ncbi:MAG: hypothetical protein OXU36_15255 [Candidatus Poribacteria bacterium]|nr:hypothetical protein [Candidatus Poribacteria bacterium]
MLHDLLSSRWFQGGFAFFVLCVSGSLLYSWHVHRTTAAEFGKRPQPVMSIENRSLSTNTAPVDFQTEGVTNMPEENTDTPISESTEAFPNETEFADMADAFLPDDFVSEEEAPAEDVPVSPYGFGPYPEIPADFPSDWISGISWFWSEEKVAQLEEVIQGSLERRGVSFTEHMKTSELIGRLNIQLWNEGLDFDGMTTLDQTGLFYPNEPDVLYVKWGETKYPNGNVRRYISQAVGSASSSLSIAEREGREPIPDWIEIRSLNDGINPYEYLGLNR